MVPHATRIQIPSLVFAGLALVSSRGVGQVLSFSVSGNPATLTMTSAIAGSAPNSVVNATTTYAVTTLLGTWKIRAQLGTPLPTGVTLTLSLSAPSGATSQGPVALTTTAQDLVKGITTGINSGLTITYTLAATSAAGVVSLRSVGVTLTVVADT